MRCFVVILMVVACAGIAATAAAPAMSCASSKEFFARHNASADDNNEPGIVIGVIVERSVCNGECCGRGRESHLRTSLKRLAVDRAIVETRPVAELLLSTRRTLLEHLLQLSHQSQNKTGGLLTQLYRSHAVRAHTPLANLYEDIRISLRMNAESDSLSDDLGTQPPKDLAESARKFFEDIFPVAYQSVLKLEAKQFTIEYEACLKDAYNAVKPFGDVPQKMGTSLSRSLKAARALLEVLAAGAGVLAASEHVLSAASEECSNHLLRAVGCSRCKGYNVKPCRAYCLNVARGCVGSLVAELDAPWAGYVEGLERLVRAEADVVLREIEGKVSEAIMYALENQVTLENKVRQECGPTSTMDGFLSTPSPTPAARRNSFSVPPPDAVILEFTASLAERKKLFAGLADEVCDEPDFAEVGNDNCWDGKNVGEYTKPLVLSASLADQKYNPEVLTGVAQGDAKVAEVAALGDKLRQARQLLVTTSWGGDTPAAESFMQGDEANEEGSGSGRGYDDDSSYDQEGSGEEGSGTQDIGSRQYPEEKNVYTSTPKTAGAATSRPLTAVIFSAAVLTTLSRCIT